MSAYVTVGFWDGYDAGSAVFHYFSLLFCWQTLALAFLSYGKSYVVQSYSKVLCQILELLIKVRPQNWEALVGNRDRKLCNSKEIRTANKNSEWREIH